MQIKLTRISAVLLTVLLFYQVKNEILSIKHQWEIYN
jgi:hypothetical protein